MIATTMLSYCIGRLTHISNLSLRINETLSQRLVQLYWNEPFMDNTYRGNTVDAYLLEINAVAINTTEARATITLLPNVTDITIDLMASNCFGLTPVTTFHLNLHQGKMTGTLCLLIIRKR